MLGHHSRVAGSYRVTFSPEAWQEIGRLSSTAFQALQKALEQLAQQGPPRSAAEARPSAVTVRAGSLVLSCERDDQARILTLRHVTVSAQSPGLRVP